MKVLFIGGTKFVGRNMVEKAISLGHEVHILQRGTTNANLFPGSKKYIGDRVAIDALIPETENFDLVIDTCGYHPEIVEKSCKFLKDKTQSYVFISSGSAYSDFSKPGLSENSSVGQIFNIPPLDSKITGENYGPLKALCEKQVIEYFGLGRSLILRPTIIVGPYDDTNRFDFWIKDIMTKDTIEVPNDPEAFIQFIDVRALSQFSLESYNRKTQGIYNVIGPKNPITFIEFINLAKRLLKPELKIQFVQIKERNSYPMYTNQPDWKGFFQIDGAKAYDHGLKNFSVEETILNTANFLKRSI